MSSKTSTTKTTKSSKKIVKEVVPETVVEAPVEESFEALEASVDTVEVVEETIKSRFERLVKVTQDHISGLKLVTTELRKLQRDHEVAMKEANKKSKTKRKMNRDGAPRKASGFASPVTVSDEMYQFLAQYGVEHGTPIARTDVTRHITVYIRENNLQNPAYRREIVPNVVLKNLLGPAEELKDAADPNSKKVYTYLRLQKYLSKHFPTKKSALPPTETA